MHAVFSEQCSFTCEQAHDLVFSVSRVILIILIIIIIRCIYIEPFQAQGHISASTVNLPVITQR